MEAAETLDGTVPCGAGAEDTMDRATEWERGSRREGGKGRG